MFRYFCSCSDICKYPGSVVLVSPGRVVVVLTLQLGTAGPGPDTVIVMKSDPICNKTPAQANNTDSSLSSRPRTRELTPLLEMAKANLS